MKISIFAAVGSQNLGDELILKNEIKLLEKEFKNPIFRVFSYDASYPFFEQENISYHDYFPIDIKNPKNIFKNIRNFFYFLQTMLWSNLVVIGGGGIFYDSELQSVKNPLDQWLFRTKIARLFRKKIYFYGVGIDIKQEENFKKLEKIFKKAWKITVRDKKSAGQLLKLGTKSKIVDDPVMSERNTPSALSGISLIEGDQNNEIIKKSPSMRGTVAKQQGEFGKILSVHSSKSFKPKDFVSYDFSGKKVGLALRSGYIGRSGDSKIEKLLVEELCSYIEKKGGKIVFMPHSFHPTDTKANDYIFMNYFLKGKRKIQESMQEVYDVYRKEKVDVVISMRLHSIVLSYVYGIDQIVLSYSQKTDEFIKKIK